MSWVPYLKGSFYATIYGVSQKWPRILDFLCQKLPREMFPKREREKQRESVCLQTKEKTTCSMLKATLCVNIECIKPVQIEKEVAREVTKHSECTASIIHQFYSSLQNRDQFRQALYDKLIINSIKMFLPLAASDQLREVATSIQEEDAAAAIKKCVQMIIILGQDNKPIKRSDLNKAFSQYSINSVRAYKYLIEAANLKLYKLTGLRLYELDDKTRYLLVNGSSHFAMLKNHSDEACMEYTVLYLILMEIFGSQSQSVPVDSIKKSLEPLRFSEEDLKNCIEVALKKMYIIEKKDDDERSYIWGPRAYAEVEPDNFYAYFKELLEEDPANNQSMMKEYDDRYAKLKHMPNRYLAAVDLPQLN